MPRRLLVSIHDVGPRFEREVDQLVALLSARLGGPKFAMLVVPDHWSAAPLTDNPAFARRLREWSQAGVEMFVHGWTHRDDSAHQGGLAQWKASKMTAGEGEFLGLARDEALARMERGRTLIEQAIGGPVAGFIAPAWLYGPGALAALKDAGFALAEDHLKVWSPRSGQVLTRGPVITWASRSRARIASSLAVAAVARTALRLAPTIRVAVHPGDTTVPALLASIDRTLTRFTGSHCPSRYAELLNARSSSQPTPLL